MFVLSFIVAMSGCECGKKSDEELLRERIDTTAVHLYLATKIGIVKADQSPEAAAARDAVLAATAALQGTPKAGSTPARELTAKDALTLAKALYSLREEGQELLASGDEKGLEPFLPLLFEPNDALAKVLDVNMEHALLLTGMFVIKFDGRSPVPIPPEIMLYEAWRIDTDKLLLPGMGGLVAAEKAIVYAGNELCDLAAHEADVAEKGADSPERLAAALGVVAGGEAPVTPENAKKINAGARTVAHGASAYCYQARDEGDKAVEQLDKALDGAQDLGVPEGELALARAYVAMQRGQPAKAKQHLEVARDYSGTQPDTKKDIEEILANLDDDPNAFEATLGKAFFMTYLIKIVLRTLDDAGAFDGLVNAEVVTTIHGYLASVGSALGSAKDIASPKGWLDKAKALVASD